jgi:AraC-like DNA-binding protein
MESYIICMQLSGTCRLKRKLKQGYEEILTGPGDIELFDASLPGEISFDTDYRRIVLLIPQHVLRPRLIAMDHSHVRIVRANEKVGRMASNCLRDFALDQLPEPTAGKVSNILVELLALAFNEVSQAALEATQSGREALRHEVCEYVKLNLANRFLSPESVAARFDMSLRSLHSLFSKSGETLMRRILSLRLERCKEALANPAMRQRNILDIALDWGFNGHSHFGRVFKDRYGMTPREWRAEALRARDSRDRN